MIFGEIKDTWHNVWYLMTHYGPKRPKIPLSKARRLTLEFVSPYKGHDVTLLRDFYVILLKLSVKGKFYKVGKFCIFG
jgi:hypothetical protein